MGSIVFSEAKTMLKYHNKKHSLSLFSFPFLSCFVPIAIHVMELNLFDEVYIISRNILDCGGTDDKIKYMVRITCGIG